MSEQIGLDIVERRLREADLPFTTLDLDDSACLVVTAAGGRLLGPFPRAEDRSLLWINPAFRSSGAWKRFRSDGGWNLGGDRVWIAPEIQFSIRDRGDVTGSYLLPPAMDPGHYTLSRPTGQSAVLQAEMDLKAYNIADGLVSLSVERRVEPAPNPLRSLSRAGDLMEGVTYCGYEHHIRLYLRSASAAPAETWSLIQLPQGGAAIIPLPQGADVGWYWKTERTDTLQPFDTMSIVPFLPGNLFKMGFRAAQSNGTAAYVHALGKDHYSLIIRRFFINPSATYSEEPFFEPGDRGYALHLYNSGNDSDEFGEIECNGHSIGGDTGRTESHDTMLLWAYQGPQASLREIFYCLGGISRSTLDHVWPEMVAHLPRGS